MQKYQDPLYEATKEKSQFHWTEAEEKAFTDLKQVLLMAPALALSDITHPFHLYVDGWKRVAKES